MKSSICAVLFLILIAFCVSWIAQAAEIACTEPNTVFSTCPNNCSDQCPTSPPQACTFDCREGCYCKDGYKRAPNQTCVPIGECPIQCPDNEEFTQRCTDGCDENLVLCKTSPYGCYCKQGFKRINGSCVPEKNCFSCGENEVYSDCASACNSDCPASEPESCAAVCIQGCTCKPRYKRDRKTGKCIPEEQCVVKCPRYSTYGCVCNDSCMKDRIRCITCNYRCACNNGYSRINGVCRPDRQCPRRRITATSVKDNQ